MSYAPILNAGQIDRIFLTPSRRHTLSRHFSHRHIYLVRMIANPRSKLFTRHILWHSRAAEIKYPAIGNAGSQSFLKRGCARCKITTKTDPYTFAAASPAEWLKKLLDYDLTSVAKRITCPMLVVDVESENSFPGEARKLYDALVCPKTWLYFTEEEGAGDHCQTGSPALAQQRIFDWLQEMVI
jgi:hypothetical protein